MRAVDRVESFLSFFWGLYILDSQYSFVVSSTFDEVLSLLVMARVRLDLIFCQFG